MDFNGAKNNKNLSKFVGVTWLRRADSNGQFFELASARGTTGTIDTQEKSVDVITDTRGSVLQGDIPVNRISLTFLENASAEVIAKLFNVTKVSVAAGAVTLTNLTQTFDGDEIELNFKSNDGLGVTGIEVKSADGLTPYTITTDYTTHVVDGRTYINRVGTGAIAESGTVLVSGTYNANASESAQVVSKFRNKPIFEVKIEVIEDENGTEVTRTLTLDRAKLTSTFGLEFLDVVKAGDITGAEVTFEGLEGSSIKYYDEII